MIALLHWLGSHPILLVYATALWLVYQWDREQCGPP